MHYHVSRNGQTYGPYTLEDLQRYLASGNVLPTDLAKTEEMTDWLPVSQTPRRRPSPERPVPQPRACRHPGQPLVRSRRHSHRRLHRDPSFANPAFATPGYSNPAATNPAYNPAESAALASQYPDAPNLHWGLVLLFGLLTCTLFMVVWNLVVAAWLKRVQPNATSLFYYIGFAVLLFLQILTGGAANMHILMRPGIHTASTRFLPAFVGIAAWVVKLIARYSQMSSLEEHFNGPEPVGLRLNGVMVFFFGGVYFQYHLNRINAMKHAARFGAGRAY